MRFERTPATAQLVRLAALGVDVRKSGESTFPAPVHDSGWIGRWQRAMHAFLNRRRTLAIEPEPGWADVGKNAEASPAPPVPAAGGARVYQFPQPAGRRLR
jgi:hypothetical protein